MGISLLNKRTLGTVVVVLVGGAVVATLFKFNQVPQSYERYLVGNIAGLLWVPMLSIFFLIREQADDYGFGPGDSRRVWLWVVVLAALALIGEAIVARWSLYQSYYPMYRQFGMDSPTGVALSTFIYFELTYGMYLFCWEFFFRGYLLFGLSRSFGAFAVVLQAIPFGIMHWGKPEFVLSFAGGLILGALAYRARSFLPAFVLHWIAALGMDVFVVAFRH